MGETSEKENSSHFENCLPPAYSTSTSQSSAAIGRLLRFGAAALIVGAVLMLCASIGAFYLWKVSDRNVYNVHYSMSINGKVKEGSMEIDSDNNLERFRTGSGDEAAQEIHDFQIGITGIRFFGGEKCYIKSEIKANLPDMGTHNKESLMFDLVMGVLADLEGTLEPQHPSILEGTFTPKYSRSTSSQRADFVQTKKEHTNYSVAQTDEIMPVKYDGESLIWVAADQPLNDTGFLSTRILDLCGDLPIYWIQPTYPKDGERRKRDTLRAKRQFSMEEFEPAAEEKDVAGRSEEEEGASSAAGSALNPENPYHQRRGGGGAAGEEEGTMAFDPMLDHLGICCSECRRSYTHCQRVCEPLRGHWPWTYNYRGCQVACRVILPCRWWVARILGVV